MEHDPTTRLLARTSTLAITGFVTVSVILPVVQRGHYSVVGQTISELALGRWGWIQNAAFCLLGAGTITLGIALKRGTGARMSPILFGINGVLDMVSASFHAVKMGSPTTAASTIHTVAGISTFLLTYAAMFALVRPLRRSPAWSSYAKPTLVWASLGVAAFLTMPPPVVGQNHFGIGQRIMAGTFLSWMFATSIRAQRTAAAEPKGDPLGATPISAPEDADRAGARRA